MCAGIALSQAFRQSAQDGFVAIAFDRAIPAKNPHDPRASVPASEPLAIARRIFRRKYLRTDAPALIPLIAPSRQQADVQAEGIGSGYHPVGVLEVLLVGLSGIVCNQRQLAVSIRFGEAI